MRSCFLNCGEAIAGKESTIIEIKSVNNNHIKDNVIDKSFLETFLEKYPHLFKICCFCLMRRRQSVANHCDSNNKIEEIVKFDKDLDIISDEFTTLEK